MKRPELRLALAGSLLVLLVACGGGAENSSSEAPEPTAEAPATTPAPGDTAEAPASTETAQAPAAGSEADYEVKMGSDTGQLVFVPAQVTAKPGDTIKWIMNKAGPHNAVFDASKSANADAAKAMTQTKLLNKPGDSYITTVPAGAAAGSYSFNCTPHKAAGMVGVLTVQP
ncbi:MAG: plastocyanin [Gemmatimonadaceae bacterium]|nr:plastocyanin [Gloeobacterales cyanobacterium ES-bin-141]